MAWGRRCDTGCASWPHADKYEKCPVCGEATTAFSNLQPLSNEEAIHREFEVFYERFDAERDPSRLEGDAPNALGRFGRVVDIRPALLERNVRSSS